MLTFWADKVKLERDKEGTKVLNNQKITWKASLGGLFVRVRPAYGAKRLTQIQWAAMPTALTAQTFTFQSTTVRTGSAITIIPRPVHVNIISISENISRPAPIIL